MFPQLELTTIKIILSVLSKCNIDIIKLYTRGLASGISVLNDNELTLGSVVLEIGATTTSLSIFAKGNFLFSEASKLWQ